MIILGTMGQFVYPDAPRYLAKNGRLDEAVTALQYIGSANNVDSKMLETSYIESIITEEGGDSEERQALLNDAEEPDS